MGNLAEQAALQAEDIHYAQQQARAAIECVEAYIGALAIMYPRHVLKLSSGSRYQILREAATPAAVIEAFAARAAADRAYRTLTAARPATLAPVSAASQPTGSIASRSIQRERDAAAAAGCMYQSGD